MGLVCCWDNLGMCVIWFVWGLYVLILYWGVKLFVSLCIGREKDVRGLVSLSLCLLCVCGEGCREKRARFD